MKFNRKTIVFIFAVGLISCATSLYVPTQNDASALNTTLENLQNGRKLYINNCASCHNLHLPSNYTSKQWSSIVDKMQKRARIDDSQKELIKAYLKTNSKK